LYKSKLQLCIEILCTLASNGPLKLTQLTHKVELDEPRLIPYLSFLYDHCLVGEQNLDEDEKAYFVTERGVSVLKVVSPLIREAQRIEVRNFEAISSALSGAVNSEIKKEKRPKRKWKLSDFIKIEIVKTEE
jgi:predicted transcriptional regulator